MSEKENEKFTGLQQQNRFDLPLDEQMYSHLPSHWAS